MPASLPEPNNAFEPGSQSSLELAKRNHSKERQLRSQESQRILFRPDYDRPMPVERLPAWQ